jgi:hypothetical protein
MIRPNNRLFWLIAILLAVALTILIVRPVRQFFGVLVWDSVLVPLYTNSNLLLNGRVLLAALAILLLLAVLFWLSPLWDAFGLLDSIAMSLARAYYNRFARYGVDREGRQDRDPYAWLRGHVLRIGYALRFMKRIPLLSDVHALFFNDAPSPRVALLLINRVHEASYFIALGRDQEPDKLRQRWTVATGAMQALAAHMLVGSRHWNPATSRLIGALLLDDLHSQSIVLAARHGIPFQARFPAWRDSAARSYRELTAGFPRETPWGAWILLRLVWLGAFTDDALMPFDWARLSVVEEHFWRLTELAGDETGFGIAIAAAHRLATDLVALPALGHDPGATDLLRFGADLGYWLDSTADTLRATAWHTAPSSRASELPPGTFLAGQLIEGIGPKWSPPGAPASDAIRAQMIAARGAIYELIRGGWRGMVPESDLEQAQSLARRAADEIDIEDEFGGRL